MRAALLQLQHVTHKGCKDLHFMHQAFISRDTTRILGQMLAAQLRHLT